MRGIELLKKYVSEGLSNEERFELEKLALDDNFLAIAWEGLSGPVSKNTQAILSRLESKLESKKEAKIIPLYRRLWPYAAVASVAFAVLFLRPKQDQMMPANSEAALIAIDQSHDSFADVVSTEDFEEEDSTTPHPQVELVSATKAEKKKNRTDKILASEVREKRSSKEEIESLSRGDAASSLSDTDDNTTTEALDNTLANAEIFTNKEPTESVALKTDFRSDERTREEVVESGVTASEEIGQGDTTKYMAVDVHDLSLDEVVIVSNEERANRSKAVGLFRERDQIGFAAAQKVDGPAVIVRGLTDIDTIPESTIGFVEYRRCLFEKTTITKEEAFMRGLKGGEIVEARIRVNGVGEPTEVTFQRFKKGLIADKLEKLIKSCGPWKNSSGDWVSFSFGLPIMK